MARTVQGITHTWQISDTPIGSGDAGEVFAVMRLNEPEVTGVMKRPARVATGGTILRQASQIAQEALALTLLDGLPDGKAHPPRLLDQAPEFTKGTAHYFMISETVPGEDFNAMLAKARQTGKPFPRRVIMAVLDALFDMFSRAHKAGVLWNDVKLEHIYWDNPTSRVGVIDWGNALFLENHGQHTRPRWEDYQQMVDTLGTFLQNTAPDLYADLVWDEFKGKTLDATLVSTLARRISYQQQVIALQVMEYQSLIRVVLNTDPSLEGLREIVGYQQILLKIGAPWEHDEILQYSQSLVEKTLADGDHQTTVTVTALVWEIFGDSLDLPWHLLREYCRHTDILTHKVFADLAKHTLNAKWEDALWAASTIASQSQASIWWEGLIPVMRQKALGSNIPAPYQACRALRNWAKEQQQVELLEKLEPILRDWRGNSKDHSGRPFDDALLNLVRSDIKLPSRLKLEVRQSFAQGEEAISELIKAWRNANWDELPIAFRHVIRWDPDRWGVLQLSRQVEDLQIWFRRLYDGPVVGTSIREFLENMLATRPKIERALGSPPWLNTLINALTTIIDGTPISTHQDTVNHYCPWLLQYSDINAAGFHPPEIAHRARQALLKNFCMHLKAWRNLETGLNEIRQNAPLMVPICHRLVNHFKTIFSLTTNIEQLEIETLKSQPPEFKEAYQVLQALIRWRKHLSEGDLPSGIKCLQKPEQDQWTLAANARQATIHWHQTVLPALEAIQSYAIIPVPAETVADPKFRLLINVSQTLQELKILWHRIYNAGIYVNLLEALESSIDSSRTAFLDWRVALENTSDPIERLIYTHQLVYVRQISNSLLRMTHHIRQVNLGFELLGDDSQISLAQQKKNLQNILYHLTAIEAELIPDPGERHFPEYQTAFEQLVVAQTADNRQALRSALTEDHPFFAWLVKSTLA